MGAANCNICWISPCIYVIIFIYNIGGMRMGDKSIEEFRRESWYVDLCDEGQYLFELVFKYHRYFSKKDKKFRCISRTIRLLILFFTMVNTIVLGMKTVLTQEHQIILGLIISAVITFATAVSSYFNFEEYWMRNIAIHIDLNILRDNFIFDAKIGKLNDGEVMEGYRKTLEDMQKRNIEYWQRSLKKIG